MHVVDVVLYYTAFWHRTCACYILFVTVYRKTFGFAENHMCLFSYENSYSTKNCIRSILFMPRTEENHKIFSICVFCLLIIVRATQAARLAHLQRTTSSRWSLFIEHEQVVSICVMILSIAGIVSVYSFRKRAIDGVAVQILKERYYKIGSLFWLQWILKFLLFAYSCTLILVIALLLTIWPLFVFWPVSDL